MGDDKHHLALYYAPLFKNRTPEFLHLFAEVFGNHHLDCMACNMQPRPLMCFYCLRQYIKNTHLIINHLKENNLPNSEIYEGIAARLQDLNEVLPLIESPEPITMDTVYEILNISMEQYDPPSQSKLDECLSFKNDGIEDTCSVCLCDFEKEEELKKLPCRHVFHEACIMKWLENHSTCPICKSSLKEIKEEQVFEDYNYLDTVGTDNEPHLLQMLTSLIDCSVIYHTINHENEESEESDNESES